MSGLASRAACVRAPLHRDIQGAITQMSVRPSGQRTHLYDQVARPLSGALVWQACDIFYLQAAHDSQAGLVNLKNNSAYNLVAVNSPAFAVDRGYTGNGTTSYLETSWVPSTNGVNYTLNSASIFFGSSLVNQANVVDCGSGTAVLIARTNSNTFYAQVNGSVAATWTNADGRGRYIATRSGAALVDGYRNGVSLGATQTPASTAVPTTSMRCCGGNTSATFSSRQQYWYGVCGALNAIQALALDAAVGNWQTALGF